MPDGCGTGCAGALEKGEGGVIIELIVGGTIVTVVSLLVANDMHKRECMPEADFEEARRILERDRAEWISALRGIKFNEEARRITAEIAAIDRKLMRLAGFDQ